jgi:hypothetical protein
MLYESAIEITPQKTRRQQINLLACHAIVIPLWGHFNLLPLPPDCDGGHPANRRFQKRNKKAPFGAFGIRSG